MCDNYCDESELEFIKVSEPRKGRKRKQNFRCNIRLNLFFAFSKISIYIC